MMGRLRRDQLKGCCRAATSAHFRSLLLARTDANVPADAMQYRHDKRRPQLAVVR